MKYEVMENKNIKAVKSEGYSYIFNKVSGMFMRWGKTKEDDPVMAPGPEIADIEISTICHGIGKTMGTRTPCKFCYKSNTGTGGNMSLETFKDLFHKMVGASVKLTLENGKNVVLSPWDKVKTSNGKTILVDEIKEEDDIIL